MGRHSSHALTQYGAKVLCVDIEPGLADEMAAEIGGLAFTGDMTKEAEVARMVAHANDVFGGRIHGLVDIIGIAEWFEIVDMDESVWDGQFDMCLRHAFLLSKHLGRHMIGSGTPGTMVFIASVHGLSASVRHAPYGAAKAALISLVKTIAHEMGPRGIRANAIAPGLILSGPGLALGEDLIAQYARHSDSNFVGDPVDVAHIVAFLASDLSRLITGEMIRVDGGYAQHSPMLAEQRESARMVGGDG